MASTWSHVRVALFHSSDAGDGVSARVLCDAAERAGHEVVGLFEPDAEAEDVLARAPDLVVAAGGDGMAWKAANVVHGSPVPFTIVPLGTANNIATSLGIGGTIAEQAIRWHTARPRGIDLGVVRGAKGESRFLEAVGSGLTSRAIAQLSPRSNQGTPDTAARIAGALRRYREILADLTPGRCSMTIDGREIEGEFLLLEVLNIRAVGPNLVLCPDASPWDGLLDVVMVGEEDRGTLDRYLGERMKGSEPRLVLPSFRARKIVVHGWEEMHVDDEVRLGSSIGTISLRVEAGALAILI